MSKEEKKDPYSFDVVDAMIVGGAATSVGLGLPSETSPKNSWSRIATSIGLTLAAVSGVLLFKWAKHKLTSTHKEDKQKERVYGMDDVQIIPDPNDPKKATVKMNLDPADFQDLEQKLSADKSVNWQKKVEGENKTISLTAQKQ